MNVANYFIEKLESTHNSQVDKLGVERIKETIYENFDQGEIFVPYVIVSESRPYHLESVFPDTLKAHFIEQYIELVKPYFERLLPELPNPVVLTSNQPIFSIVDYVERYLKGLEKTVFTETKQKNILEREFSISKLLEYYSGHAQVLYLMKDVKITFPDKTETIACKGRGAFPFNKIYNYSVKETDNPYLTIHTIDEENGEMEIYRKNLKDSIGSHKLEIVNCCGEMKVYSDNETDPGYQVKHDDIQLVGEDFIFTPDKIPNQAFHYDHNGYF